MEVFRIQKKEFKDSLSGKGAAKKGARWNSIGIEIIYTATNKALAMAEVAVHLTAGTLPDDRYLLTIYIPDDVSMQKLTYADLPADWNVYPHPATAQQIGDAFIKACRHCLLLIPSAAVQGDFNILINPAHADFSKIKIIDAVPFKFDNRFFNLQDLSKP